MTFTGDNIGFIIMIVSALAAIGTAFKVYYGQVAEVKDKFTAALDKASQETNSLIRALETSTAQRIADANKATNELSGAMTAKFETITLNYARRDDFIDLRTEMRKSFDSITIKIDNRNNGK